MNNSFSTETLKARRVVSEVLRCSCKGKNDIRASLLDKEELSDDCPGGAMLSIPTLAVVIRGIFIEITAAATTNYVKY